MRKTCILLLVVGCGDSGKSTPIDAPPPDALLLNCDNYCNAIQKNCMGANMQYADSPHCMATCTSFDLGALSATPANTLGCRLHFALDAADPAAAATDCAYAGPVGDSLGMASLAGCSGGDPCPTFCKLEVQACGSLNAPLANNPRDVDGNPLFQYQDVDDCMRFCPSFAKKPIYNIGASPTNPTPSSGDSFACRLLQATNAAISLDNAKAFCGATAENPRNECAGAPAP